MFGKNKHQHEYRLNDQTATPDFINFEYRCSGCGHIKTKTVSPKERFEIEP